MAPVGTPKRPLLLRGGAQMFPAAPRGIRRQCPAPPRGVAPEPGDHGDHQNLIKSSLGAGRDTRRGTIVEGDGARKLWFPDDFLITS